MPTYVYETIPNAGEAPQRFEFQQRMSDPPYTQHPETGAALRRVFTAPFIIGAKSEPQKAAATKPAETTTNTESTTTETPAAAEPVHRHLCGHGCAH